MTPAIDRIDDPGDPRVEPFRQIRERDLVRRDGCFIAEGRTVLNVLAGARDFRVEALLVLESRLDGLADLLPRFAPSTPVYVVSRPVIDAIAGFPMHRGVLALARRTIAHAAERLLSGISPDAHVLGLVGIANHDNMGGIFRNAAAFGAGAVLLDPTCCDPLYRKAIRVSVGGVLKVPFARVSGEEELLSVLGATGRRPIALSPNAPEALREVRAGGPAALLLGTEGEGLPPALLRRVRTARIPMRADFDSLNVATTSGIALYEMTRPE